MADKHIVAIDLGTSKIALTVARINGRDVQIVYYKETPSEGIRYSSVYNQKQVTEPLLRAVREAESYPGPSVIVAYTPCAAHGIQLGMGKTQEEMKRAVESGYWNLYRYDPRRDEPLIMDSKAPSMDFMDFLAGETRYASLRRSFPQNAEELFEKGRQDAEARYEKYRKMEENQKR